MKTTFLTQEEVVGLIASTQRTVEESVKVQFVFASGHTYTANNVLLVDWDETTVKYVNVKGNDTDSVSISAHAVSKDDLVYALVIDDIDGSTNIIHGLVNRFDVNPTEKLQKALMTAAHDAALAEERNRKWKQKETAKYHKRKKQRAVANGKFGTEKVKREKKSK